MVTATPTYRQVRNSLASLAIAWVLCSCAQGIAPSPAKQLQARQLPQPPQPELSQPSAPQKSTPQPVTPSDKIQRLALAETRPISLDLRNASLASVLEAIRASSDINFVVDRDVPMDQRASIFIRAAQLEDAIDLVLSAFQLARRIVDEKTVMVYPNTPDKHKVYREQIIRVFHLAHAQAKTTAALLQNMLRIQPPFVDERANFLALREPPDIIALAERLVALHDFGDADVMLEVEVLEIKTSRLTELGINFPSSFTLTPLPPPGQNGLTLGNIRGIDSNRVGVGVAGLLVNLKRTVGDFKTLANPRIRTRNREKATIMIGDKVPVATSATTPTGFLSESISYLDVGLKLEVEPTVSPSDEVTLKLGLEVSSIAGQVRTPGGSLAYQIGTRNANTMLRLKDGETQVLGGLISNKDQSDANRLPGLGDLPFIGRLFSSQADEHQRTELVLAITPRILRSTPEPDASQAEMWVGTENFTRLKSAPKTHISSENLSPGPTLIPQIPKTLQTPSDVVSTQALTLKLSGPDEIRLGETFTVVIHADSPSPLMGLPMDLRFSTDYLQMVNIEEGGYFKQNSTDNTLTHAVNDKDGLISMGLISPSAQGMQKDDDVVIIRFKAIKTGTADIKIQNITPLGNNVSTPNMDLLQLKTRIR